MQCSSGTTILKLAKRCIHVRAHIAGYREQIITVQVLLEGPRGVHASEIAVGLAHTCSKNVSHHAHLP